MKEFERCMLCSRNCGVNRNKGQPGYCKSDAGDYPDIVMKAILEIYRQKGSRVIINENDHAVSELIIRHLVLPGCVQDSKKILVCSIDIRNENVITIPMHRHCNDVWMGFRQIETMKYFLLFYIFQVFQSLNIHAAGKL